MAGRTEVADNAAKRRYEILVDREVAGASYYHDGDGVRTLTHTEVGDEWEGQGIGSRLVAGALDDIRERGLSVTPVCPFTAAYIERHPEYQDLVAS
jgi:predicted GNAT family acetyltransferase